MPVRVRPPAPSPRFERGQNCPKAHGARELNGAQTNDPAKLAATPLEIANMEKPPKIFAGGDDALAAIRPAIGA